MAAKQSRPRWLQLSVRTLLVGVTLLCIWLAVISQQARRQEKLVRIITAGSRNSINYAHQETKPPSQPPGPHWLRSWIGDHYFFRPHTVVLRTHSPRILDALVQLDGIESVFVDNLDDGELRQLAEIATLRSLQTDSIEVTGEGFASLEALANLETIVVSDARVDDSDLRKLARLDKVKSLGMTNTLITSKGIEWAKNRWPGIEVYSSHPSVASELTYVEQLCTRNVRFMASGTGNVASVVLIGPVIGNETLELLRHFKELRHVRLLSTSVTPTGVQALRKHLPDVKFDPEPREPRPEEADAVATLTAKGAEVHYDGEGYVEAIVATSASLSDANVMLLGPCRRLKTVWLTESRLTDKSLEALAKCSSLTSLDIPHAQITDDGVQRLEMMVAMRDLTLNCERVSSRGFSVLWRMSHLRNLALHNATLRSGDLDVLGGASELKSLDLTGARIEEGTLKILSRLPALQRLTLNQSNVMDASLRELRDSRLVTLQIRDTSVTDEGFAHLHSLSLLRRIDATNTLVTETGVESFRNGAPKRDVIR